VPPTPPPPHPGPRYRVQFTADQAFLDLLEKARDLLQHSLPSRDLVEVQRRALQTLVKTLRARKLAATDHPRARRAAATPGEATPEDTAPARRPIPAAVRRTVWQRDAARCTYTDLRGQRCRERAGLELHHVAPHARGGPDTVDNLTLRCSLCRTRHKRHYAEFGFMPRTAARVLWASWEAFSYAA
jgi:hypothetical protein